MNEIEKAIQILYETKAQFNSSILDADCGNIDALENIENNKATIISLRLAIQELQEKAKRDKMRCVNCKHEPKNPTSKTLPCSMCSVAYASYFEPKESNGNG